MNNKITFGIKIMLQDDEDIFFGPGVAELLRAIERTGNVKEAAATMKLSYTKAWTMLKNTKRGIGEDAVVSKKGGIGGGYAYLTDAGKELLERYEQFEAKAHAELEETFRSCFNVE